MSNQTTLPKYINGVFMTEREGKFGKEISMGITEEGLASLKSIPPNEKGVRNFTANRQKNDDTKFSLKPWQAFTKTETVSSTEDENLPF